MYIANSGEAEAGKQSWGDYYMLKYKFQRLSPKIIILQNWKIISLAEAILTRGLCHTMFTLSS